MLDFLRTTWKKAASVSTRTKIMGIVIFLLFFFGAGITLQTSYVLKRQLTYQLQERALYIARDLSEDVVPFTLLGRLAAFQAKLDDTVNNGTDVSYIIISDIRAEGGGAAVQYASPAVLPGVESLPPSIKYKDGVYISSRGGTLDVVTPVRGEQGGQVRVGMSESRINHDVWTYVRGMLIYTAALSFIGLLASFYFIYLLTRPLKELVGVTRSVARGDLQVRARTRAEDDIGSLGEAFNSMIEDLEKAHKERQNLWTELKKREEMRGQFLEKVIRAQEDERKRIARQLHDETSQSMASFMVGLKMLEQEEDGVERRHKIRELREMASTTMDKVRDLALELRPSSLDDLGLLSAVEQYSSEFGRRFGIKVDYQAIGFDGHRLSPEKETVLYRIIQEALINVARHSNASTAGVILEYRNNLVRAIIEDDGRGFEMEKVSGSSDERRLGILGMQERAALAGGKLSIESTPGKGTTVFVEIPL